MDAKTRYPIKHTTGAIQILLLMLFLYYYYCYYYCGPHGLRAPTIISPTILSDKTTATLFKHIYIYIYIYVLPEWWQFKCLFCFSSSLFRTYSRWTCSQIPIWAALIICIDVWYIYIYICIYIYIYICIYTLCVYIHIYIKCDVM